mmetsp:Transcript_16244/g.27797  ORF Transcript_16244/g.27797 Transcript_16244/m.27797 type:complete len:312 (-) Transcript_16244:55-990(-)|eukprot:CAMPEP_0168584936 /NCGR_PEP_ID=MMETSP0420-20121227/3411_1 /TAXON_ID=498008 /ORGANISM="Pessonella sp." /LENGTH=311 /DNA_ID=CAMNT_0008619783 /DNA_START=61 /DNA_END=996 /DNA_ORIENTATION=-
MSNDVADALAELPGQQKDDSLDCRMYANQYPAIDEIVVVRVEKIAEMGAYVSLLEYNNIEGMILLSELSRRRIRSINKLIRVGRIEYVVVLRVDTDKGYIDLSKRRVAPEDIGKAENKYNKSKAVHSLLKHVASQRGERLDYLYNTVAWPLAAEFGHAYEAFKIAIVDPERVFAKVPDCPAELKDALLTDIRQRLTPQPVRVRADIECTCFSYEGVDGIRAALMAGMAVQTEHIEIKIKLLAPPLYVMWCSALDKDAGVELLEKSVAEVERVLKEQKGTLVVKIAPRCVTEREDAELSKIGDDDDEASDSQ